MTDTILILDFGSQVTQLIARRVREAGVYSEIVPFSQGEVAFDRLRPKGIILSGGPASVYWSEAPRVPRRLLEAGLPVLGICYGNQTMVTELGGNVEGGHNAEFGRADIDIVEDCALFKGVWSKGERDHVWMSHGDKITRIPDGFRVVARSDNAPYATIADERRRLYGVLFHPEVAHTPRGAALIRNFVHNVAGCRGDWTMAAFRASAIERIRRDVGKSRVICGLSGGVDSAVAAVLIHEAIGDQLTCIFVDHGLLRLNEGSEVVKLFREHYNIPLVHVDASRQFLTALDGVSDPERKRKTIGALFIDVFEAEAKTIGGAEFLAQGTLYPD
ncbi:MAG TPA: glutamine-hydrolyzing GMP synthase, partial [Hyphomicrobiaceae bacterium]|nr:glutamine-hydrolyzing GMP synthase [Hyphomicrobiaceae bacterium]